MASKVALVGLVILVVGLIVGVYGAAYPSSASSQQPYSILNTSLHIDPNDYQSQNLNMTAGETINLALMITNQTIFQFYIMNQSQYYTYYGCAPFCHTGNVSGVGVVTNQNLTTQFNSSTITPNQNYTHQFTAPSTGVYYFIFDNTVGPSWATYYGQNSPGFTDGSFSIVGTQSVTKSSINWVPLGAGIALLIIGGAIATAMWETKPAKPSAAPVAPTTTTTPK